MAEQQRLVTKPGENVTRVAPDHRAAQPGLPWRVIDGMRNRLTHDDDGTDHAGRRSRSTSPRSTTPCGASSVGDGSRSPPEQPSARPH
ncbi:hypothetical protein V3N99_03255 [Dermatophilaceae bacterium Soc4.6]